MSVLVVASISGVAKITGPLGGRQTGALCFEGTRVLGALCVAKVHACFVLFKGRLFRMAWQEGAQQPHSTPLECEVSRSLPPQAGGEAHQEGDRPAHQESARTWDRVGC